MKTKSVYQHSEQTHVSIQDIVAGAKSAEKKIKKYIPIHTPLVHSDRLSSKYECDIWIKREDQHIVRSFKIRGALNKILEVSKHLLAHQELVCASAGNHAQGFAYSCNLLKKRGVVFMPNTSPMQKVNQVKLHGKEWVTVVLEGDNFDACLKASLAYQRAHDSVFIHPFNDMDIICGQATVGLEILDQTDKKPFDYLFICVGGGGLSAGVNSIFKHYSPSTMIYGCEPLGAASMKKSLRKGKVIKLASYDTFVDGAAVARVGEITFEICKDTFTDVLTIPEGHVCHTLIDLYNLDAIVAEPAGALSIAGLDFVDKNMLKGKKVCVILSGGNNDIIRMAEIQERSLLYQGKKYYFMVDFPQRPGALRDFLSNVLEEGDDISFFEYVKKNNRDKGPAIVGIETQHPNQLKRLSKNMKKQGFSFQFINDNYSLFNLIL